MGNVVVDRINHQQSRRNWDNYLSSTVGKLDFWLDGPGGYPHAGAGNGAVAILSVAPVSV